jgi:hypothetical protein
MRFSNQRSDGKHAGMPDGLCTDREFPLRTTCQSHPNTERRGAVTGTRADESSRENPALTVRAFAAFVGRWAIDCATQGPTRRQESVGGMA